MIETPKVVRRINKVLVTLAISGLGSALGFPLAIAQDTVTVDVKPVPEPTIQTFPSDKPPSDLKPGEAGDTTFRASLTGGDFQFFFDGTKLTITSVGAVIINGQNTIRLPNNASGGLKDHENGHADLNKDEYNRTTKKKVEDAFRGLKGMMFTGEGDTPEKREENAAAKAEAERDRRLARARDAIQQQVDTLTTKYDKLTKHGTSDTVDTAKGKEEAKKERDKAIKDAETPKTPDHKKEKTGVNEPPSIFFDSESQRLFFGGDRLINRATNPADTIIGRGEIEVGPVVLIGLDVGGNVHLSGTTLRITDVTNQQVFMDALIYELIYMPSIVPGFAGMIQGGLDIPTDFVEGISNTIGSQFLDGMRAASASGEPTIFWFFAHAALFDEQGFSLIPQDGITGAFEVGVAVPEPATGTLMLVGITVLIPWCCARRVHLFRACRLKGVTYL